MYSRQTYTQSHFHRRFLLCALALVTGVVSLVFAAHHVEAASPHVDVMVLNGEINPASLHFLTNALQTAERDGAHALVIEIDTPGGDLDSMKSMTLQELASSVPIISYVSPTGGRAASAGAFVALAAQVAAMAPTTRIGASSPVTDTGGDIGSTLKAKIENDLTASITGIQKRYGRNVDLAKAMVTSATSYDDATAVKAHLVDLSATNLKSLLTLVQGRVVTLNTGQAVPLQTADAEIQTINASALDALYGFIIDPNIVFLLFIVAMIGLYVEFSHPGLILPGVAGGISLLLFLFAIGSLAPNWTGLALMGLAFVLLILDVRLPTHGVLTLGAVVSLIFGALLLFGNGISYGGPELSPIVVYTMGGVIGLLGLTLVTLIVQTRRQAISTGTEAMIGVPVVALTPLNPSGRVRYGGEDWAAVLDNPALSVGIGTLLQITAVEGLRLHVQPVSTFSTQSDTHDSRDTHSQAMFE